MSISGIPSNSNAFPAPATNSQSQFRASVNDLAKALNAGDMSAAQSAFLAIQQLQPAPLASSTNSGASASTGAPNSLGADIATLGKALQSGDLSSAQDAFKKVQQDLKSVHHGHHHHKHGGGVQSAPSTIQTSATSDRSARS